MDDKRIPLIKDEAKHKKKSKAKGLSRADHKHTYETVLLHRYLDLNGKIVETKLPTKVCTVCGRIDYVDRDDSYYRKKETTVLYLRHQTELSQKALNLSKWYTHEYFDKFAYKGDLSSV